MGYRVTVLPGGKSFEVASGESVLAGAGRAGLALPYSCLGGVCGSCKATLISGRCSYPRLAPSALSAEERAHGDVLLCQAVPQTDLVISAREVPSVADLPRRVLPARVISKQQLATDVMRLCLRTPSLDPLRWLAGQYLDVLLDQGRRRAFSIANAPHTSRDLELHIRRVPGGGFTQQVFDALPIGSLLRIEGPLGTFVAREHSERPILLLAGGTGFAPIKALIEHFLHLGTRRNMHCYWGVRRPEEVYLPELPDRFRAAHPGFDFQAVVSEPQPDDSSCYRQGPVHEAALRDHPNLSEHDVYMSGPPPMIQAARQAFSAAGLPAEQLFYDSFEYAPDVLAAILAGRAGLLPDRAQ